MCYGPDSTISEQHPTSVFFNQSDENSGVIKPGNFLNSHLTSLLYHLYIHMSMV
jgi:hypothetical protein